MHDDKLPGPLRDVVERLAGLPGLGPKSALRAALALLAMPRDRAQGMGKSIIDLREELCLCELCGALTETSPCHICTDPMRDRTQLCVVSEWDSLLVLEQMGVYKGMYLILGGLISPLDGVEACNLEFDKLRKRLDCGEVEELILGLGATVESESTCSYVKNLAEREYPGVKVTRLAQGIPMGAEVKYMDKETLRQSLTHRQEI